MSKRSITRVLLVLVVAVLTIGLLATAADAAKRKIIKLRVVAGHPPVAPWVLYLKKFFVPELEKRVLAKTTKYEVKCEELYGGSAAKLGEVLEAVESGMADVGMVVSVFEMSKLGLHNFPWWFPFGSPDMRQVLKATNATFDKFPALDEVLEKKYKQRRIGLVGLGSYHFVSNFPIRKLEDMKGKKMAHGGPMLPWLEALGSVAVQSRLNEAFTCLQTGVYDGWAMEPNATVGFKLFEPAPYYTIADLGAGVPCILTVNNRKWKKLPKEVQDILLEVGKDYEVVQADASAENHMSKIGYMALRGVEISKLSDKERERFAKAMNDFNVADKMAKEQDQKGYPGSEMARFYIQFLIDEGYKWPNVPTIK